MRYGFKKGTFFSAFLEAVPLFFGSYNIVVFLTIYISYANNCFTL